MGLEDPELLEVLRSQPPRFHPPPPMKMGGPKEGPKKPPYPRGVQALANAENQMAMMRTKTAMRTTRLLMGYASAHAKSITERVCTMVNSPGKVW